MAGLRRDAAVGERAVLGQDVDPAVRPGEQVVADKGQAPHGLVAQSVEGRPDLAQRSDVAQELIAVEGERERLAPRRHEPRNGIESRGGTWTAEEEAAFRQPILDQYEHQGHPYFASARLWDDGVIDPADTRRVLALALSASLNAPIPDAKFGVFRM